MGNSEINKTAEDTSRKLIDVFYLVNILFCIIVILVGFLICINYDISRGIIVIFIAIVGIVSGALTKALLHTFVNISIKLSMGVELLKKLDDIEKKMKIMNLDSLREQSEVNQTTVPIKNIVIDNSKLDGDNIQLHTDYMDEELDRIILELIGEGKILDARSLLIRKKNMTFSSADAYVEKLRKKA